MSELKKAAAEAACNMVTDEAAYLGIGSGSTVAFFIEALKNKRQMIEGCVASSLETEAQLKAAGLPVISLAAAPRLSLYIDGADEVNQHHLMIKGGGGALTREKIIASVAERFVCIVDESKVVNRLGTFPVAVEVLPIARSLVAREVVRLGGDPVYREDFITDNGNQILDVYHLNLNEPIAMEEKLKLLPGVVETGIFAKRTADTVLVASASGVQKL